MMAIYVKNAQGVFPFHLDVNKCLQLYQRMLYASQNVYVHQRILYIYIYIELEWLTSYFKI